MQEDLVAIGGGTSQDYMFRKFATAKNKDLFSLSYGHNTITRHVFTFLFRIFLLNGNLLIDCIMCGCGKL